MASTIPVDAWHYTAVVVRDFRQVIPNFSRFFGITRWEVVRVDGKYLENATFEGDPVTHRYISAYGHNGDLGIVLIQPVDGPSSYQAMLDTVGEGMHHVCATVTDPAVFESLRPELAKLGVGVRQSGTLFGAVDSYLLDTRALVSNIIVEVQCPRSPDWRGKIIPDEIIEVKPEWAGPKFMPTGQMLHIGTVCKDRDITKENLRRLFGMERWIEFNIESEKTIVDTTYYGKPCWHSYDNHVGRVGALCFELITPRSDQNVYDEFLKERGEGMHHTFPTICTKAEFEKALPELEKNGMPVIQGGTIPGLMEYYYVDTRRYLPGITTEVVIPLADDWLQKFFPNPADAWILTGKEITP